MEAKKSNWKPVNELREKLTEKFPRDSFLKALLEGAWRVARDKSNPIRGNLVASALREIFGHILHSLAPDADVRKCTWFEQAKDTKTVTRRQKAHFIVHAGLPPDFVEKDLNLVISDYVDPLLDAFDNLNKATHVRAGTILFKGKEVRQLLSDVIRGILNLLNATVDARSDLEERVEETMHHAVFENLISETIQELDELSTHTMVDGHFIDKVKVIKLDAEQVVYEVTGEVDVELQYGSNSDVRNDIGARIGDSYPYRATVFSRAAKPMEMHSEDIELKVDNRSFYE
ncbi:hypothetical protein JCM7686_0275 [Paracoccus aminophilus JCM 7686]|uniref:Uncharacterized protein n=1 Tax=Paracoccus aminophilus JCM 7686 TaxID=1367847 RepID=S5YQ11_PARAH|nr:hypothetical protein JCM7686_0275 [Paracoccus aminophilus JCM 7686]